MNNNKKRKKYLAGSKVQGYVENPYTELMQNDINMVNAQSQVANNPLYNIMSGVSNAGMNVAMEMGGFGDGILGKIGNTVLPALNNAKFAGGGTVGDGTLSNKQIQELLKQQGLYKGAIDGIIGKNSIRAIKEFQQRNNVANSIRKDGTGDGILGANTLQALTGMISNQSTQPSEDSLYNELARREVERDRSSQNFLKNQSTDIDKSLKDYGDYYVNNLNENQREFYESNKKRFMKNLPNSLDSNNTSDKVSNNNFDLFKELAKKEVTRDRASQNFLNKTGDTVDQSQKDYADYYINNLDESQRNYYESNKGDIIRSVADTFAMGGQVNNNIPVEVEGEEVGEMPNGQMLEFEGPSHEQGGIKTDLPEGTEIYSKRVKIDDKSMADRKKKREKSLMKLEKLLEKNPNDIILKNTKSRIETLNAKEESLDTGLQDLISQFYNQDALPTQNAQPQAIGQPVQEFKGGGSVLDLFKANPENQYNRYKGRAMKSGIEEGSFSDYVTKDDAENFKNFDKQGFEGKTGYEDSTKFGNFVDNLPDATFGDVLNLTGTAINTFSPLRNTMRNRAGDTPNINPFENYGEDALRTVDSQKQYVNQVRDNQLSDMELARNSALRRGRNSARGVNTMRAMDLAVDQASNRGQNEVYNQAANSMMQTLGTQAQMENDRDVRRMSGEGARDTNDRMDRDSYHKALASDMLSMGRGVQEMGKDLNTIKYNEALMNILNQKSPYNHQVDKDGNITKNGKTYQPLGNGEYFDPYRNKVVTEQEITQQAVPEAKTQTTPEGVNNAVQDGGMTPEYAAQIAQALQRSSENSSIMSQPNSSMGESLLNTSVPPKAENSFNLKQALQDLQANYNSKYLPVDNDNSMASELINGIANGTNQPLTSNTPTGKPKEGSKAPLQDIIANVPLKTTHKDFFVKRPDVAQEFDPVGFKKQLGEIESYGGKYDAVNEKTKAYGKYQFVQSVHGKQIKDKYNVDMKTFGKRPDLQEKYLNHMMVSEYIPQVNKHYDTIKRRYPSMSYNKMLAMYHYDPATFRAAKAGTLDLRQLPKSSQSGVSNKTVSDYLKNFG